MLQNCKYRLPCAWCDKYDRPCEAVKGEIQKMQKECEHNWVFYQSITTTGGQDVTYHCSKCGAVKLQTYDGVTYESGVWQP